MSRSYIQQLAQQVQTGEDVFIAPNATVLGDITLEENVSNWFGAVLRADYDAIRVGAGSNVQDNATIHVDEDVPATLGQEVIVGHNAIVHGATVNDNTLIGMHATILNHATIGEYCIIGANALVTEHTTIPDYSIALGTPAKVVKTMTDGQKKAVKENADVYKDIAQRYLTG